MRSDVDGMTIIRAELCDRLDSLQRRRPADDGARAGPGHRHDPHRRRRLWHDPGGLRRRCFERAIRAEPRFCPAGLYFERLRDAIGCGAADDDAGTRMIASISVRLSA